MLKTTMLLVLTLMAFSGGSARADRYLVKNPRGALPGMRVVQTIQFGLETWLEVESNASGFLPALRANAEAAAPEAMIGLPEERSGPFGPDVAWHPAALHYDQLPKEHDGQGIVVAVIDGGMDYTHPNLKDKLWSGNDCFSDNVDHDHNGYVNDCHGWNWVDGNNDPLDKMGHGTHCSGIIAASPDAGTQSEGVAQDVRIMPLRIIGDKATGFIGNAAAAIKYAVDNGAKVLSNSWRIYKSWQDYSPTDPNIQLLRSAIQYAADHNVIFVAAAGNEAIDMDTGFENDPMYPGGFQGMDNLVVVAASDRGNGVASFSNFGAKYVTVAAPGEDIVSTVLLNGFTALSGTSMAAPLVAGTLARGLSAGESPQDTIQHLIQSSDPVDAWQGKVHSNGVIDLVKYLGK
jgi:thermitase